MSSGGGEDVSHQPLCFVLMPFGRKPDPAGGPDIDFNQIYDAAIKPGIRDAGMTPLRADEEEIGGIIHKTMFERLMLCDFAVADLTTGNANVLYELGIRHGIRPRTTLTLHAMPKPLPFDIAMLRTQPYTLSKKNKLTAKATAALRAAVTEQLTGLREQARTVDVTDSPLFQLVETWRPALPSMETADAFQAECRRNEEIKQRVHDLRVQGLDPQRREEVTAGLNRIRAEIAIDTADAGVLTGLMLGHRTVSDWDGMIGLYAELPVHLRQHNPLRELLAFAHNRRAEAGEEPAERDRDRDRALRILRDLEKDQGPTSETCGLLGRIYKAQWSEARETGSRARADGFLGQAIDAYLRGFRTDWTDAYPGVNAVTLLEIQGHPTGLVEKSKLLPVVRFAAEQRHQGSEPQYWDWATMLELAVLDGQRDPAMDALRRALPLVGETWQPLSTARNLQLIADAQRERGVGDPWLGEIIEELLAAADLPGA